MDGHDDARQLLRFGEVNIKTLKQQVKPINIFLWVYILLLLPLSFSFLENYLIVNFAFPSFVLDYFQYNLHLFFFVLVFLLICFWFTWIWCFVFHFMILKDMNFLEARKASSFLWKKNKGKFFKKSFLVFLISFISKYTIGVWQYACGYIVYKMRADANLLTLYLIILVYILRRYVQVSGAGGGAVHKVAGAYDQKNQTADQGQSGRQHTGFVGKRESPALPE